MKNNAKILPTKSFKNSFNCLAIHSYTFSAAILGLVIFPAIANAETMQPLLGNWQWVNSENSCTETYQFNADNTVQIISGDEISDAEYHLSDKLTDRGFYTLTLKILKDHGGQDCAESLADNTGDVYHKFVMFHPSGEQYVSCDKETIEECVGPLKRIK